MTPTLSVVIACRNADSTLGVQLAALAAQECPVPWNVVVSDNGSTDATLDVARRFSSRLPGLVVVDSSERVGAAHARNVGAWATQAPLLAFCDADDEMAPGWLAALAKALGAHRFVAGRFDALRLNEAGARRSRTLPQSQGLQRSPFGPDLPHAGAGNLGIHRSVFLDVDGFDPTIGCLEDTDLCWRVQLAGVPLTFCPDALMHVRLRSSLASMWAQGVAYGRAAALLSQRYPRAAVTRPGPALPTSPVGRERTPPSIGSVLWSLGWHVGHRRRRPPVQPTPQVCR